MHNFMVELNLHSQVLGMLVIYSVAFFAGRRRVQAARVRVHDHHRAAHCG